ncbi:hypothetical protein FJ693_15630 [Georgenia yuyongxinii]|uniref:Uncharacterized protein n=1 Tax=Georgenia yuyongxinii TaxID=2589797 RepID=A0A552WMG4_9MICO|nr:hypothetical protein FJ693_15630 [Georgenia yuyongxinii]
MAVVGTAGFALGRAEAPAAHTAAPAITLAGGSGDGGAEIARDATGMTTDIFPSPWPPARTVFRSSGLSDASGTATAWTFDAGAAFTAERVAAVAAALGVSGEPRLQDGLWQVGANDGTAPSLQLYPDGQANLSYYDPTADPYTCRETLPADGGAPAGDGEGSVGAETCTTPDLGPAPDADTATARTRDLLAAAGLDPAAFEYEVPDHGDEPMTTVMAHQVVDGQRTGLQWFVALSGKGVQSASGALAPLVPLGEYAVVSPTAAVARLTDPRFGSLGGVSILAESAALRADQAPAAGGSAAEQAPAPDDAISTEPAQPQGPPAAATPGAPVAWPVREVTLTQARLGVAQYTTPSGTTLLVPAYELSSGQESWSVVALAEAALDLAP